MTKIRASNAAGKSFYANHLASNDYYSEHEKVVGFWRGSLAENFGLAGQEVTTSVFSLFQRNIDPATGNNLTPKKVSGGPRFFDFQVAAPKSVSVMALFDDRLTAAHQAAVREAMGELEALAAVRIRHGENVRTNNHENTGKLIYAEFMHDTSRALDPQLHTHNVVCNVTDAGGQYKALETLEMCKAIRYAGKVYHNALGRQCRELGYDLIPVLDKKRNVLWFDLAGVPAEVMERFSKRRKQIEETEAAFIAEHGRMPTLSENNAISNSTRSAKMLTSTRETVRSEQLKQLSEDELKQLEALVKPNAKIRRLSRDEIVKAIRKAAAGLFERESVVTQDKLLAEVLNTSLGSFDLGELKGVLSVLPELKNLGGEAVNPFYSPEEVIERETRSIESVEDQKGIFEPVAPGFVPFPDEASRKAQSELITGLLSSPDRFNLFRGVAGAGKTSTLQEFCRGLRSGGVENIVVVAPTNSATEVERKIPDGCGGKEKHAEHRHPRGPSVDRRAGSVTDRLEQLEQLSGQIAEKSHRQIKTEIEHADGASSQHFRIGLPQQRDHNGREARCSRKHQQQDREQQTAADIAADQRKNERKNGEIRNARDPAENASAVPEIMAG